MTEMTGIRERLERGRLELLDLSSRNRLLNVPRRSKQAKTIEIADEKSEEVYRLLVRETKSMSFLPALDKKKDPDAENGEEDSSDDEFGDLPQPDDSEPIDERGIAKRHGDLRLQTLVTSEKLQKRLLSLYYDAQTFREEQGVNILYLALGMLRWYESPSSEIERHAPLLLIPVTLERKSAAERFRLRWDQEDPAGNLSLQAKLKAEFGLIIPLPEDEDELELSGYFASVQDALASQPRWEVLNDDMVLGFFSFSKFLMYRDLDSDNWPEGRRLDDHRLIAALLRDGFESGNGPAIGDDDHIDDHISPARMIHVVDADSSQTLAIEQALGNGSMVIQGPPGTGKSQTITNIIAAAVARGEKVLFMAEKMAALEVVKRRLETIGLGAMCLELHSHKMTKTAVLADLQRTSLLGRPALGENPPLIERLERLRDRLNRHSARINTRFVPCSLTPFEVIGQLVELQQKGRSPSARTLTDAETWTPQLFQERERLLTEIAERIRDEGLPVQHPWRGVRCKVVLRMDLDRLMPLISEAAGVLDRLRRNSERLATLTELPTARTLAATGNTVAVGRVLATAPPVSADLLVAAGWGEHRGALDNLIETGLAHRATVTRVVDQITERAWTIDVTNSHHSLMVHGRTWLRAVNKEYRRLRPMIKTAAASVEHLRSHLNRLASVVEQPMPKTFAATQSLISVARVLANAPVAPSYFYASSAWAENRLKLLELIKIGLTYGAAATNLSRSIKDKARNTDVSAAHQALVSHGNSWLRVFKGDYRRALALVNAIVEGQPPKTLAARLGLLDRIRAAQKIAASIGERESFGRDAFGQDWQGADTDWQTLAFVRDWLELLVETGFDPELRKVVAKLAERHDAKSELNKLTDAVDTGYKAVNESIVALATAMNLDFDAAFGTPELSDVDLSVLGSRLDDWVARPYDIRRWISQGIVFDTTITDSLKTIAALQNSVLSVPPPKSLAGKLSLFRRLAAAQRLAATLVDQDEFGQSVLGPFWRGTETDWNLIVEVRNWLAGLEKDGLDPGLRLVVARLEDRTEPSRVANAIETDVGATLEKLGALADALDLDRGEAFGQPGFDTIELAVLAERLAAWQARPDDLSRWISLRARLDEAAGKGLGAFIDVLRTGALSADDAVPDFRFAYFEALLRMMAGCEPDLTAFHGDEHDKTVEDFRTLDRGRIELARLEVAHAHHRGLPKVEGGLGPLGVLRGEFAKRKRHMPIRKLIRTAAPAIQALKPVFMMSPLSVAQFLEPGSIAFDLLLIDEASQVMPIDALGGIARCHRMVVVGDDRQLPPSRFFAKAASEQSGDEDDNDTGNLSAGDIESILGLCEAKGLSRRMLRWHYRSRHQSLIAVSNREFYENRLFIVPSPHMAEAGMGLRFHYLKNGVYDSGNTATNAVEATAVAEAVIAHVRATPNLTLGVATFSIKQKQAIHDELERLRRAHPDTEEFFQPGGLEPFFVKNLENIQGDERDVIMISVGYGRNKTGALAMRFGPLSSEGGERRLNVLISRAKHRCEVFASITDEDINLDRAHGKGVAALKVFLQFARTGRLEVARSTDRGHDSVFEEQVAEALRREGYDVRCQIGLAGFFIDLAVADPERPGRYVLGIECDGATYHSSRSARDRDRLRQEVLENHGWIIHRIWRTDWFQRPEEQLRRTVAAIEAAKIELESRQEERRHHLRAVPLEIVSIDREETDDPADEAVPLSEPYRQATMTVSVQQQPHEVPAGVMARIIHNIVEIEGPIHTGEIIQRVRGLWGLKRAGSRIEAAVRIGLRIAAKDGRWQDEEECWMLPGTVITVRDRSVAESSTLRKPDTLPPQEIREAIRRLITAHYGATLDQLTTGVARLFGFKATSIQLKTVIEAKIEQMRQSGELEDTNGTIGFSREKAAAE
ncbi:MAG: DUF3320 domain-containing protein [Rhodospirillaceae bacterium]